MISLLLALTITVNTDLQRISDNLDLAYKTAIESKASKMDFNRFEDELRYIRSRLDKDDLKGRTQASIIELYLLSIKQMEQYLKTKEIEMFKNSMANKIYADAMLAELKIQDSKNEN